MEKYEILKKIDLKAVMPRANALRENSRESLIFHCRLGDSIILEEMMLVDFVILA